MPRKFEYDIIVPMNKQTLKEKILNKNLITNLIAAAVCAAGYISPYYGKHIRTVGFFALSGGLTNWLAVIMLFEKIPFIYGSGVIPNHFKEFKTGIKHLIMDNFFTDENITRGFESLKDELMSEIDMTNAVEGIDYDKIFDAFKAEILGSTAGGLLGAFGGAALIERYRASFREKVKSYILEEVSQPGFLDNIISFDPSKLGSIVTDKIESIILDRLEELTPQMVKEIIQEMIRQHLGWLVVWGGLFGGVIGLIMSLLPF